MNAPVFPKEFHGLRSEVAKHAVEGDGFGRTNLDRNIGPFGAVLFFLMFLHLEPARSLVIAAILRTLVNDFNLFLVPRLDMFLHGIER